MRYKKSNRIREKWYHRCHLEINTKLAFSSSLWYVHAYCQGSDECEF